MCNDDVKKIFMSISIPTILVGFGIFISIFIVNSDLNTEKNTKISEFNLFSESIFLNFKSSIESQETLLLSMEQFYSRASSEARTVGNFTLSNIKQEDLNNTFFEFKKRFNILNSIGWLQYVKNENRINFENGIATETGINGIKIVNASRNPDTDLPQLPSQVAPNAELYLPVTYLASETDPDFTLNKLIDVYGFSFRKEIINKALMTCKPATTEITQLITTNFFTKITFVPIFNINVFQENNCTAKTASITGYLVQTINIGKLLDDGLSKIQQSKDIKIYLFDFNEDESGNIIPNLFFKVENVNNQWTSNLINNDDSKNGLLNEPSEFLLKHRITFFDRSWTMIFLAGEDLRKTTFSQIPIIIALWVLIIGGSLTYLYTIYFYEQNLNEKTSKEILTAGFNQRKKFINYVFHEVRVPLNTISTGIVLLKKNITKKAIIDIIKTIHDAVNQSTKILNDMLDLHRLENGRFTINADEGFNVYDICKSVILQFIFKLKAKKLDFKLDIDETLKNKVIYGDKYRIIQCLSNYVSNAIKYTDEGIMHIKFSIKEEKSYTAIVNMTGDQYIHTSNKLLCEVIDTGVGIDDENKKLIFMPYTQILSPDKSEQGTGLGLVIVNKLIELHNGKAYFTSERDKGSNFYFEIPYIYKESAEYDDKSYFLLTKEFHENITVNENGKLNHNIKKSLIDFDEILIGTDSISEEIVNSDDEEEKKSTEVKMNILLADDTDNVTSLMKQILEMEGHKVTVARNGKFAVDKVREQPNHYDLILMDNLMPIMTGIEASKLIKEINKDIKIIAVTGMINEEDKQEFINAGIIKFVNKPIEDFESFITMINQLHI